MTVIKPDTPVVIIGGGLAGLSSAAYLRRHGVPVRLFEASNKLAGLSRSEIDADGFTYDFGAHFITNRLAAAVGISAICREVVRYGECVWLNGRSYAYPFGLMRKPEFLGSALAAFAARIGQPPPVTALQWYRARFGRALAEQVAVPLSEAWSGVPTAELAADVGNKITSIPRTVYLTGAKKLTGRTVAIGYSTTFPENPHVWHVYPEGGIGGVCEKIADEVRDCISMESPVESILVENNQVRGVCVKGALVPASAVVSTAPVHILAKLVQGTERLAYLRHFKYRAMVFVNVKLLGRSGLPDVVTWTPEGTVPFFRLSDIGAGLPWLVPASKSLVTCDIGCQIGDEIWKMGDNELGLRCVQGLARLATGVEARYLGCRVLRVPLAYPVFRADYEDDRKNFERDAGIAGLYSIGRNGEFRHLLMEDVYWRSRSKMLPIINAYQRA